MYGCATHFSNDTAAEWQKKLPNVICVVTAVVVGATALVLGKVVKFIFWECLFDGKLPICSVCLR